MRVRVESSRCHSHALCAMIAPGSIELGDVDGHAQAVAEVVPTERRHEVAEAARSCPEQAIIVSAERVAATRANGSSVGGGAT